VRWKHIDNPVDRLGRVLSVQRPEDEVAGLGGGQRGGDGLEVSHLPNEDDVGILTQGVLEGGGEAVRVGPDLPLVDERLLVLVEELDGVLDRHDVVGSLGVDEIDEGGERRRLARARDPSHEDHAALQPGELLDGGGQTEIIDRLDFEGY